MSLRHGVFELMDVLGLYRSRSCGS